MSDGKIFLDAANNAEAKAKVVYNYYKQAAEKIIAEEDAIDAKIASANEDIKQLEARIASETTQMEANEKSKGIWKIVCLIIIPCILVFPLVLFLGYKKKVKENQEQIEMFGNNIKKKKEEIEKLVENRKNVRRSYKIHKLQVVNVPIAKRVPYKDKSMLLDLTNSFENTKLSFSFLRHPEDFSKSIDKIEESVNAIPVVETTEDIESIDTSEYSLSMQEIKMNDFVGNMDRTLRDISYELGEKDTTNITIPIIPPKSDYASFISDVTTTEKKDVVSVFDSTDVDAAANQLNVLNRQKQELEKERSSDEYVRYLEKLMTQTADVVQNVLQQKNANSLSLVEYYNNVFARVLSSSFNHYSSTLEGEEIERLKEATFDFKDANEYQYFNLRDSSRVKFDLFNNGFVTEDDVPEKNVFSIHQVNDEIIMPVIRNLLRENRVKRLDIYNDTLKEKRDYVQRWNEEVQDFYGRNRTELQRLTTEAEKEMKQFRTDIGVMTQLVDALNKMGTNGGMVENGKSVKQEELVAYNEFIKDMERTQEDLDSYMDRLKDDIETTTDRFNYIEYYDTSLVDEDAQDVAKSMDFENLKALDDRRKDLIKVSPYVATYATLPPALSTEESLYESVAEDLPNYAREKIAESREFEDNLVNGTIEEKNTDAADEDLFEETESTEQDTDFGDAIFDDEPSNSDDDVAEEKAVSEDETSEDESDAEETLDDEEESDDETSEEESDDEEFFDDEEESDDKEESDDEDFLDDDDESDDDDSDDKKPNSGIPLNLSDF
jgi:hypothetical protein